MGIVGVAGYDTCKGEIKAFELTRRLFDIISSWEPINTKSGLTGMGSGTFVGREINEANEKINKVFEEIWNTQAFESESTTKILIWGCKDPTVKEK